MKLALALSIVVLSAASLTSAAEARGADNATTADRAAVLKTLNSFFSAMQARDGGEIRKLVVPKTMFYWTKPSTGGPRLDQESIEEFIPEAQGASEPWIERIWSPTVRVGSGIAVVWAPYDFYRGKTFSHNGTDCYVFLKTAEGWKIAGLTFTVEPGPGTLNPKGPPK